jgi:hypothetical protein
MTDTAPKPYVLTKLGRATLVHSKATGRRLGTIVPVRDHRFVAMHRVAGVTVRYGEHRTITLAVEAILAASRQETDA